VEGAYDLSGHLTLTAGVKNAFNRFPDKAISQGYSHPYVYPSFSPFGINGAFYYVKGTYTF
jgi:iron complex outermembrane receptor protein